MNATQLADLPFTAEIAYGDVTVIRQVGPRQWIVLHDGLVIRGPVSRVRAMKDAAAKSGKQGVYRG